MSEAHDDRAALDLLHAMRLSEDYAEAWTEWSGSADAELWESTVAEGIAAR